MTDSLRSVLPRPVAIFLIAGCLVTYIVSPKEADQRLAYARGSIGVTVPLGPTPDTGVTTPGGADNVVMAGFFAVIDRGPWPIAGAMAVPFLALALRRRCES
jgi:hypothetical protein